MSSFDRDYSSSYSIAEQDQAVNALRSEVFDLKMQMSAQAEELRRLSNAEQERNEMEDALNRAEAILEDRDVDLNRAETRVAILEAEVEQVQHSMEEMQDRQAALILARQSEGFRILRTAVRNARSKLFFEGFFTWRACVIDRAAWRLGMARRAAFAGNTVPPPPRKTGKIPGYDAATQTTYQAIDQTATERTNAVEVEPANRKTLDSHYQDLLRETREKARKYSQTPEQPSRSVSQAQAKKKMSPVAAELALARRLTAMSTKSEPAEKSGKHHNHSEPDEADLDSAEKNFGQNIVSIQEAVRGVLSTRKGRDSRQPDRPEKSPRSSGQKLSSKEEIRKLLVSLSPPNSPY